MARGSEPRIATAQRTAQRDASWPELSLIAVGYFLLGRLSFAASVSHDIVTLVVFAAEGLSLAAAIRFGRRVGWSVLVGQTLLAWSAGMPPIPSVAIGVINGSLAVAAATLSQRWKIGRHLEGPSTLLRVFALSALVLQPLGATAGIGALFLFGRLTTRDIPLAWFAWWLGNVLGQCITTPAFLAALTSSLRTTARDAIPSILLALLGALAFGLLGLPGLPTFALMLACYVPVLLFVSVWFGVSAGAWASVTSAATAVTATAFGRGPFLDSMVELDLFLVGTTLTALVLGTLFEQRRRLEAALLAQNQALERTNAGLAQTLQEVKTLRGLVPICASCKNIRTPDGEWHNLESVLTKQTEATLTHGLCDCCFERLYGHLPESVAKHRP